jgi:CheY-like chemotaxis protein/nitrogen-specific signal transduction histidine kinase
LRPLFIYVGIIYARQLYKTFSLNRMLVRETGLRNIFMSYIFHELRNPLNALNLSLSMLETTPSIRACLNGTEYDSVLANMGPSISTMQSILNDTLDYQKLASGTVRLTTAPFSFGSMVRRLVASMEPFWRNKDQHFILDMDPALDNPSTLVVGDELKLRQVIANYLSNAVKYTDPGGSITLSCKNRFVEQGMDDTKAALKVEVIDNGLGIRPEDQVKLFQPFVQIDNRSGSKGTGLGLSIVAAILKQMGGTFGVRSQINHGSTFWFQLTLPVSQALSQLDSASTAVDESDPEHLWRGKRMLVVDDDGVTRKLMRQLLQSHAIQVSEASNGQEALDEYFRSISENQPYALILTDDRMTPVTGQEVIRTLRNQGHMIPIIALTGDTETRDKILKAGASHVLIKPVNWEEIRDVFRVLLAM